MYWHLMKYTEDIVECNLLHGVYKSAMLVKDKKTSPMLQPNIIHCLQYENHHWLSTNQGITSMLVYILYSKIREFQNRQLGFYLVYSKLIITFTEILSGVFHGIP